MLTYDFYVWYNLLFTTCFGCVVINHKRAEIVVKKAPLGHDYDFGD